MLFWNLSRSLQILFSFSFFKLLLTVHKSISNRRCYFFKVQSQWIELCIKKTCGVDCIGFIPTHVYSMYRYTCMHSPRPTGYIFDRGWAIKKCMLVVPVCVVDKADHLVEEKKRLWPWTWQIDSKTISLGTGIPVHIIHGTCTGPTYMYMYMHILPTCTCTYMYIVVMYRKSISIQHFEQCNQQLSNLICQNCDGSITILLDVGNQQHAV